MSTEMISQINTPSSSQGGRQSLRANAMMSPTTVRKAVEDKSSNELFSPTSAAALALSSLHQFGAQRDNRNDATATELKGTRLFLNNNDTPPTTAAATQAAATPAPVTQEEADNDSDTQTNTIIQQVQDPPKAAPSFASNANTAGAAAYRHQTPTPPPTNASYQTAPATVARHATTAAHAAAHSWRCQVAPLPMHHPANFVARYNPYTHAQLESALQRASPAMPHYLEQQQPQLSQQAAHTYNRASPISSLGPYGAAPMQLGPAMMHHPQQQPPIVAHTKFARLASCASTTLVTPTPKKAKLSHPGDDKTTTTDAARGGNYSRKKKSLGILAENFLNTYQGLEKGSTIVVDEAAIKLGVERRRIYDVVNILESICLVCKKHKNTYTWMGMEHLDTVFGRLQAQAIAEYPEDAERFLGSTSCKNFLPIPLKPARKQNKSRENKSLAKLSQEFLQVFLVGHETLSLPEASDKIQGTTSMEELIAMGSSRKEASTEKELKAAAARGLKTKIRRLYDIANVFLSVGLLKKVEREDASRRPNFSWSYRISAQQLYHLHSGAATAAVEPLASTTATA